MQTAIRAMIVGCAGIIVMGTGLSGCAGPTQGTHGRIASSMSVSELVAALKAGDIKQGDKLPLAKLPWAWVEMAYHNERWGVLSSVYVVKSRHHIVSLYLDRDGIFAANTVERVDEGNEIWHFCNMILMARHIELSVARAHLEPIDK